MKNNQKCAIASEIQKKLSNILKNVVSVPEKKTPNIGLEENEKTEDKTEKSSTKIPFFDILYENLFKASSKKSKNYKSKPIIQNLNLFGVLPFESKGGAELHDLEEVPDFIPKLVEDSNILTNEHFLQILDFIPPSLKLRNWKLVYSNALNGMSLNTLFFKCEDIGPNIVVIEDFKGWTFGAFCSDSWSRGQQFYGKGETFLFTFKDTKKINSFLWTGRNYDFQVKKKKKKKFLIF